MANMLTRGVEAHAKALKRAAGVDVVVRREGRVTATIKAVPATSTHTVDDADTGIPTKIKTIDWIFTAADLVFSGVLCRLQTGDQITRASDGATFTVAPIAGRPCTEPHDQFATMIIAHTQQN